MSQIQQVSRSVSAHDVGSCRSLDHFWLSIDKILKHKKKERSEKEKKESRDLQGDSKYPEWFFLHSMCFVSSILPAIMAPSVPLPLFPILESIQFATTD